MSAKSVKDFLERLESDRNFATTIREFSYTKEVLAYAEKAGFELTMQELSLLQNQLSDRELELVVGGEGWKDASDVTGGIKN